MQKLKILDLFSGIGGFSLGLERTGGFETIAFCDINEFAGKVLKKHWPDVPLAKDIRLLTYKGGVLFYDGQPIYRGTIDIVTGGFPCQPFSSAGKRLGTEDDRYLWPEMLRIIKETDARWVIGENVNGLRSMGIAIGETKVEGRTITRFTNHDFFSGIYARQEKMLVNKICEDLEQIRYDCQPVVIPACAVGAPHRRDRIWFIAHPYSNSQSNGAFNGQSRQGIMGALANASGRRCSKQEEGQVQQSRGTKAVCAGEAISNTESQHSNGGKPRKHKGARKIQWQAGTGSGVLADSSSIGQSGQGESIIRCGSEKNGQGWSINAFTGGIRRIWRVEPAVGRVANGIPDRMDRLSGLGNAVLPQIPEIIGYGILQIEWGMEENEILDKR